MEAGRSLDAEVAEKVMGWRRIEWEGGTTPTGRRPENVLSLVLDVVPTYSTDIAAAWQIRDRLWEIGGNVWIRYVHAFDTYAPLHTYTADDAALSICRAALEAS